MFLETVRETVRRCAMLAPGDRVLVAVSGGVDSVVLLHVLREMESEFDLDLVVAHLNHGWRGEASDADARFVASLAKDAGLELVSESIAAGASAAHANLGREGAAREARRAFLAKTADRLDADRIALGHTASDRAETILFHLTRGAGSDGLGGIDATSGRIVRPLIEVARDEILTYANAQCLAWREDASNADLSFARNRIRHRVLPELERINPRSTEAICRAGDLAGDAARVEGFVVGEFWPDLATGERPGELCLRRSSLARLPIEVRRLVLREGFRRVRGDLAGIERKHVDCVAELAAAESGHRSADLPRVHVRVDGNAVTLSTASPPVATHWESPVELGRNSFEERGFSLDLSVVGREGGRPQIDPADRAVEVADAERVAFPLEVRNRRPGDRFTPLGMEGTVRLKDFLINERVPFFDRGDVPLLCDRERILWVAGVRLSNDVRTSEATRRFLVMRMEVTR